MGMVKNKDSKKNKIEKIDRTNELETLIRKISIKINEYVQTLNYGNIEKVNIDNFYNILIKKELRIYILKSTIINDLKLILEPRDDKFPNNNCILKIIDVLYILKLRKEDIINSRIGPIIHFYSKHWSGEVQKDSKKLMWDWKSISCNPNHPKYFSRSVFE